MRDEFSGEVNVSSMREGRRFLCKGIEVNLLQKTAEKFRNSVVLKFTLKIVLNVRKKTLPTKNPY